MSYFLSNSNNNYHLPITQRGENKMENLELDQDVLLDIPSDLQDSINWHLEHLEPERN